MIHLDSSASIKLAFLFIALTVAAAANASLLDCTKSLGTELTSGAECIPVAPSVNEGKSYVLRESIPSQPIKTALVGFQLNQTRTTSAVPESAPLLVLVGALLAVLLVRAKSCNTK
jgi:hypothetical protein